MQSIREQQCLAFSGWTVVIWRLMRPSTGLTSLSGTHHIAVKPCSLYRSFVSHTQAVLASLLHFCAHAALGSNASSRARTHGPITC